MSNTNKAQQLYIFCLISNRELEIGGVIVNGTSSTRADGMPYGGVKNSGFGKEGPHYAMREMTVERLVMLGP